MKGVASGESGDDTLTGGATYSETTETFGAREVDSGVFEQPQMSHQQDEYFPISLTEPFSNIQSKIRKVTHPQVGRLKSLPRNELLQFWTFSCPH